MVVKDEHDRILITREAASENGADARQFLQRCKDLGLNVTVAFSDYSQSFTAVITAVWPQARFQADHFHTVKNSWRHLNKLLLSYRRKIKGSGEAQQNAGLHAISQEVLDIAVEPPEEAQPFICGGKAGHGRARKRGRRFCAQLPL